METYDKIFNPRAHPIALGKGLLGDAKKEFEQNVVDRNLHKYDDKWRRYYLLRCIQPKIKSALYLVTRDEGSNQESLVKLTSLTYDQI